MDKDNKILLKVFYWNDNRSPIDQVEEIEDLGKFKRAYLKSKIL